MRGYVIYIDKFSCNDAIYIYIINVCTNLFHPLMSEPLFGALCELGQA